MDLVRKRGVEIGNGNWSDKRTEKVVATCLDPIVTTG
jgi:hypothetical protein